MKRLSGKREKTRVERLAADIGIAQPCGRLIAVDQRGSGGCHQQEDRENEAQDGQKHLAEEAAGTVPEPRHVRTPDTVCGTTDALGVYHIGHKPYADGTAPVAHSRFENRHDTPPAPAASAWHISRHYPRFLADAMPALGFTG